MDDIPSVTALHQDAANDNRVQIKMKMQQNADWVLGMTCLHRGLAPMDDIPSVTVLHEDEYAAKCQSGPGNDLPT